MRGVRVLVEWDDDDCEWGRLPQYQIIPREVYEAGYLDGDAVSEYLSDKYGHLVKDWYLAKVTE